MSVLEALFTNITGAFGGANRSVIPGFDKEFNAAQVGYRPCELRQGRERLGCIAAPTLGGCNRITSTRSPLVEILQPETTMADCDII